jgi:hypothetical protein
MKSPEEEVPGDEVLRRTNSDHESQLPKGWDYRCAHHHAWLFKAVGMCSLINGSSSFFTARAFCIILDFSPYPVAQESISAPLLEAQQVVFTLHL